MTNTTIQVKVRIVKELAARERMIERLALKIVGRSWPCYGDGQKVADEFYADLERMGREQGYKFTGD